MDVDRTTMAEAIADFHCAIRNDGYVTRALIHTTKGRFAEGETEVTDGESDCNRSIVEFALRGANSNRNPTLNQEPDRLQVQSPSPVAPWGGIQEVGEPNNAARGRVWAN
jgi:hypothetical protein